MTATVRSFDIFDTVIARKAVSPHAVFSIVEARSATPGFARHRLAAAFALENRPYTLDDIYAELGRRAGYPPEKLATLREMEVAAEFEQVIPIAENLRQIRDGDLLITDMYLPEAMIFGLLERAGMRRHVHLIRTASGKRTGEVWRGLAAQGLIARHLGDNPDGDKARAEAAGHAASITRAAGFTEIEDFLFRQGFCGTALVARMLRLTGAGDDPESEALRLLQGQVNVPLLIIASFRLAALLAARYAGINRVAFCARDCAGWLKLFRATQAAVGAAPLATDYFYTSRLARQRSSNDYVAYARHALPPGALLVDLCGSGLSVQGFLARHGIDCPALYLFKATAPQVLQRVTPLHPDGTADRVDAMIDNAQLPDATPMSGELMNLVDHGMVLDVRRAFGGFLPEMAELEFTPGTLRLVVAMRNEVDRAVACVTDPALAGQFAMRDALVPPERANETLATLWNAASRSPALHAAFADGHLREDQKVHELLLRATRPGVTS